MSFQEILEVKLMPSMVIKSSWTTEILEEIEKKSVILEKEVGRNWVLETLTSTGLCQHYWEMLKWGKWWKARNRTCQWGKLILTGRGRVQSWINSKGVTRIFGQKITDEEKEGDGIKPGGPSLLRGEVNGTTITFMERNLDLSLQNKGLKPNDGGLEIIS